MNSYISKYLQREYDLKRQRAISEAEARKNGLLNRLPKYGELLTKKNTVAIDMAKTMLKGTDIDKQIAEDNLKIKLMEIDKQIEALFVSEGLPKDYLYPKFECSKCEDTGFIKLGNKESRCPCFTQKVVNITYKQNNMLRLEDENFNTFDIAYFSNKADKEKYQSDKSPLQNIEEIKKVAISFVDNMTNPCQKNLLFTGRAGTGKTFMSSAIAHSAVNKGYSVLYQTAPLLMDMIIEAKFSGYKDETKKEQYNRVFDVDLLIIDDLGTETLSNSKFTELFNIINTRLLKDKKTIISTNLTLQDLAVQYDDRVMSRLIGNYTICRFFGDDIRLKKKRMC
ncbi:MAG: ATP-binding protein [Clostridia bacterium]|nr:ATP-binding protein [Clostridia bacterium]